MAATVETRVFVGAAPGAGATAANIRLKTADDNTQDTSNPLVKPAAGVNYSFWKTVALHATVAPDNDIDNTRIFSDGAIGWTGVTLYVGDETTGTYDQATGTAGTTGDEMVANHTEIAGRTDMATFTSGSPKTVTDTNIGASTGRATEYVVFQAEIATSAGPGNLPAETLTWRFDET